jgi:hypothetical protein
MSHPFEVGKTYRNRAGEYVVQALDGDRMTIRYQDGRTQVTSAQIQARIWENIQFERQMARAEERKQQALEARAARQRTARARQARPRPTFDGFEAGDFEPKTRGIAWSSRSELGRLLAYELAQRTQASLGSWIVPRRSKVHVARKEFYDREASEINAALFVSASDRGISYGFHVGKPAGKVDGKWPWSVLVVTLSGSPEMCQLLHAALASHGLRLDVYAMETSYGRVARITAQGDGFLWQHDDAEQEVSRPMSGEELAEYLREVAPKARADLFVRKRITAQAALQAGANITNEILAVFEALLPLYDASVGA